MPGPEQDSREAYAVELARDLNLDVDECRLRVEPLYDEDIEEGREQLKVWRAEMDEMADIRRAIEGYEKFVKCRVSAVRRSRRMRSRESHRGRAGHRRSRSTRAGPDPDEPEPALRLAPPPKTIYNYAVSRCPTCGVVLLWSDGRLVCASRSCPRWGRPA